MRVVHKSFKQLTLLELLTISIDRKDTREKMYETFKICVSSLELGIHEFFSAK